MAERKCRRFKRHVWHFVLEGHFLQACRGSNEDMFIKILYNLHKYASVRLLNQDLNPSPSISLQPFQKVADISECPYLKEDKHSQRPDFYRWFHGNLAEGKKPHYCCKLEKNAWYNRVPRTKMCSESDSRSFDFSRMRRTGFSFNSGGLESCSPSVARATATVRNGSQTFAGAHH